MTGYYIPMECAAINKEAGRYFPSSVKAYNNETFAYWQRSLMQRIISRLDLTIPESWEGSTRDFLIYCLLCTGYVFVSESDKLGYWFQPCTLKGFDLYYQPTSVLISNPSANNYGIKSEYKLHEEGELLKFQPDYRGVFDIISYYAEKLASLDVAINTGIINSKIPFIIAGKNKATVEALKKIMDKINRGEPAVYTDKVLINEEHSDETPWQHIELQKARDNYMVSQQLVDFQTILNSFDAEIGITTVPYQKAERMVSSEASSRNNDSQARLITAIECMQSSIKEIKILYPDIKLDIKIRKEGTNDSESNLDRDVQLQS